MEKRIAILGAGQLAKYLAIAGHKLGLSVTSVATSALEPACQNGTPFIAEPWTPELMLRVFQENDIVTFENEWISDELLSKVKQAGLITKMIPRSESMFKVRTKWDQKQFFLKQNYPTARTLNSTEVERQLSSDANFLKREFPRGVVIKESELAYDGKGVFVFEPEKFEKIPIAIARFAEGGRPWYLEEKIPFQKELALVFVRSKNGSFVHYPLAQFESEQGICSTVIVEGINSGLMAELERQAVSIARDLAEKVNWCGTAAIEFFFSEEKGILINEFAPRVHNSGHFSLTASQTSQFENHMRAIAGIPLGACTTSPFAIMKNLLGATQSKKALAPDPVKGIEVFWYGKKEIRPGRKMGHLNAHGSIQEKEEWVKKISQMAEDWKDKTV